MKDYIREMKERELRHTRERIDHLYSLMQRTSPEKGKTIYNNMEIDLQRLQKRAAELEAELEENPTTSGGNDFDGR